SNLRNENAIIISEGDDLGKAFFRELYGRLGLNVTDYTFEEHDETIAYSLSIPFAATLAFAGVMKPQDAPGTTFKRHMQIAEGLMSEDDYLVSEILFNPRTPRQLDNIIEGLAELKEIVSRRDSEAMAAYLARVRHNVRLKSGK
ncbi:MAG: prephenate dehydrogenase/arogenate dehydrogenase family protein, partial [Duncaniella sp.]|nr:prephenate dehydrogenase/arogenate dehydrogenase family protein [Duncaniella sp.]